MQTAEPAAPARRLRGALGNALVWAGGWLVGGVALAAAMQLAFGLPFPFLPFTLALAKNLGAMGFLTGGAFSLYLGIAGRRRTLDDLSPIRFGIVGGILSGLVVPAFHLVVTLGGTRNVGKVAVLAATACLSALFGGVTALGTISLAQRAPATLRTGAADGTAAPGSRRDG